MPKASVIMPCFNHARFVADAVDSILRQTDGDLELIIIDDCSTDNSWEVMSRFAAVDSRIKLLRHPCNQGLSRSRNDGLRVATGAFIAFCDSDDIWEPQKLKAQGKLLEVNLDYDVVYSDTTIVDENGRRTGQRFSELFPPPKPASGWLFRELAVRNFVNIQSVLMRKECLLRGGLFDETVDWIQDWWYWVQLSRHHRFLYTPEPLARYRVHSCSTNVVHRRSYSVNRLKVFGRILREYADLPPRAKADINYQMGVDLCDLRKPRWARRFLWTSARWSMRDVRACGRFCKASARILFSAAKVIIL